jgi:hypothetical protein
MLGQIKLVVEQEEDGFQDSADDTQPTQAHLLDIHEAALKVARLCDGRPKRM